MKRVKLTAIELAAPNRRPGYLDACLKEAKSSERGILHIPDDAYVRIQRDYAKPRGLGDVVERAIDRVTLGQGKKVATRVATLAGKKDCGCNRRRDKLNEMVPFK